MTDVKQVKVDNWGIYFLQRLKHFFNRTDYCDLTLQFQDNAQLKVHRLVLSACTEYFELLERTCEMYEDCLVMPDDLQADVVVPIVNFMYTGHLEFRTDLLERLYQTSQILNMPVLTKLLESHRIALKTTSHNYGAVKRFTKTSEPSKLVKPIPSNKRSYSKAFDNNNIVYRDKKAYHPQLKIPDAVISPSAYRASSPVSIDNPISNKKSLLVDPRPTRYELPEELDNDNVFDNSFCNISYTCKPLMIHPENIKRYSSKRGGIFSEASSSKKLLPGTSTVDIVECKRIANNDNIFDDSIPEHNINDDLDIFQSSYNNNETTKDSSQLFDQILDDGPKVTIETKDSKAASNLDHAKIISEVLKKYPHLVKSNKNIKLKILNTPTKGKKQQKPSPTYVEENETKIKPKLKTEPDYTYETDVIDSQQAAKLIAMGAENTKGPWICLICGTPGKALHFTSYYKFRRHLVEVHNEKPVSNICEYCGLRSLKRNYLLHHLYSQHGVEPPPQYHFPKCNRCNYIALTEGLLVKHKMTHKDVKNFRCNVCSAPFTTTKQLLQHIQVTGHKYSAERKTNLQCIYCLKSFLRDGNLYAHLKTYHKKEAKSDGIIEDSDDEKPTEEIQRSKNENRETKYHHIKFEPVSYDNEFTDVDVQYQIQQRHDGDIQLTPRKQHSVISNTKQKILNPGFGSSKPPTQKAKPVMKPPPEHISNFLEDISMPSPPTTNAHSEEEIVLIDNTEYIMRDNQLIPRKPKPGSNEYIISDMIGSASLQAVPTTSLGYTDVHNAKILEDAQSGIIMKKTANINQPIQIVVSNEEEYKALMASNHPILFDNGDANKTLTVLTAPHNSRIESASIDLDNAQSNDMMIIQEDYPLNVTEAVSSDNSNIVVVYSHPVDQNKQFQILTTGGIGSQFVQSSAIIAQNYETVTTSAPTMSTHVLEPQADANWQDEQCREAQQMPADPQPELQNVVHDVQIKPIENEISNNLSELPEVHLTAIQQPIVPHDHQVIEASNALNVINSDDISQVGEQEIEEESHNIPETQIETDVLSESMVEPEAAAIIEPMQVCHEHEITAQVLSHDIIQDAIQTESIVEQTQDPMQTQNTLEETQGPIHTESIVEETQDAMQTEIIVEQTQNTMQTESITEQTPDEIPSEEDHVVDSLAVTENSETAENIELNNTLEDQQPLPESQAYDDIVEMNNHDAKADAESYNKETGGKIHNLALEWSEDEYDIPEDAPTTNQNVSNPEDVTPLDHSEETIENIQLEVQNHINNSPALIATIEPLPDVETEESGNSITEDTLSSLQETQMSQGPAALVPNDPQTKEKISSLLNDWEDNDSQEDNNSDVPAVITKPDVTDAALEKDPKTENIKSLVSDWDDEEDETKQS